MHRLAAIAAMLFGLLLFDAVSEAAHAHDGVTTAKASTGLAEPTHDPVDHSHLPGEDLMHQIVFHGGGPLTAGLVSGVALPCSPTTAYVVTFIDIAVLHGITVSPPDRPPSR